MINAKKFLNVDLVAQIKFTRSARRDWFAPDMFLLEFNLDNVKNKLKNRL